MKKERAERLFNIIGEIEEIYVTEAPKRRKAVPKAVYAAGICAAAAMIVLTVWQTGVYLKPDLSDYGGLEKLYTGIYFGGMGGGGGSRVTYDEFEANPVKIEDYTITELPVYRAKGEYIADVRFALSVIEMKDAIRNYAEVLGADPYGLDFTGKQLGISAVLENTRIGSVEITASVGGWMNIRFINPVTLPEGCAFTDGTESGDIETAEKTIEYLSGKYSGYLMFEDPVADISGEYDIYYDTGKNGETELFGEYERSYSIYEGSEDPYTKLFNYNFRYAEFCHDEEGRLERIYICREPELMTRAEIYPAIDYDTAFEKLINGDYISAYPLEYEITENMVKYCELVYREYKGRVIYHIPYYRFLLEPTPQIVNGPNVRYYTAVYVPAVKSEYIADEN